MERKITTPDVERVNCLSLYLEDLEYIALAILELGEGISISTEDYNLKDTGDLAKLSRANRRIQSIDFATKPRSILSVSINKQGAYFYVSTHGEGHMARFGVANKIHDFLAKKRNKVKAFIYDNYGRLSALGLILFVLGWVLDSLSQYSLWAFIATTLCFIPAIAVLFYLMDNNSVINVVTRHDAPNFFQRNADTVVVAIITAVIGWLLGKFF